MESENGLCTTTSAIHNGYNSKQITRKFETASSPPWPINLNAENSTVCYMPCSQILTEK